MNLSQKVLSLHEAVDLKQVIADLKDSGTLTESEIKTFYKVAKSESHNSEEDRATAKKVLKAVSEQASIGGFGMNDLVEAAHSFGLHESADPQTMANTILQQLGGNKFKVMTGASQFSYGEKNSVDQLPYLSMKLPRNASKANMLIISLNGKDLYNMHFMRLQNYDLKPVVQKTDIYDDQLQEIFTEVTGMATSLGTMGRQHEGISQEKADEFAKKYKKYFDGANKEKVTSKNAKNFFTVLKNNSKKSNKMPLNDLFDIEDMIKKGATFDETLKELKKAWDYASNHAQNVNKSALAAAVPVLLGRAWFALKNDSQGVAIDLANKDKIDMVADYKNNYLSEGVVKNLSSAVLEAYKDENWISGLTFGSDVEKADAEKIAKNVNSKFGKDGFSAEVIPDVESDGYFAVQVKHRESSDFDDAVKLNKLAKEVKEFTRKQVTDLSKYWLNRNESVSEASADYKAKDKEMMDLEKKLSPLFGDGEGYDGTVFALAKKNKGDFFKLKEYQKNYKSQNKYAPDIKKYIDLLVWLNDGNESVTEAAGKIEFTGKNADAVIRFIKDNGADASQDSNGKLTAKINGSEKTILKDDYVILNGRKLEIKKPSYVSEAGIDDNGDRENVYMVRVSGVDPKYYEKPLGRKVDDIKKVRAFQDSAKKEQIGFGGDSVSAATKAAKEWLSKNKPSQYVIIFNKKQPPVHLTVYFDKKSGQPAESLATKVLEYYNSDGQASLPEFNSTKEGEVLSEADYGFIVKGEESSFWYKTLKSAVEFAEEATDFPSIEIYTADKNEKPDKLVKKFKAGKEVKLAEEMVPVGTLEEAKEGDVVHTLILSDDSKAEIKLKERDSFGTPYYSLWLNGKEKTGGAQFGEVLSGFKRFDLPKLGLKVKKEIKGQHEGYEKLFNKADEKSVLGALSSTDFMSVDAVSNKINAEYSSTLDALEKLKSAGKVERQDKKMKTKTRWFYKKKGGVTEGKMFDSKEKYLEMLKKSLGSKAQEVIDAHRSFIDKSFEMDVNIPQLVQDLKKKESGDKLKESLAVIKKYTTNENQTLDNVAGDGCQNYDDGQDVCLDKNESGEFPTAKIIAGKMGSTMGLYKLPSGKFAILDKYMFDSAEKKKLSIEAYLEKSYPNLEKYDNMQDGKTAWYKLIKNESLSSKVLEAYNESKQSQAAEVVTEKGKKHLVTPEPLMSDWEESEINDDLLLGDLQKEIYKHLRDVSGFNNSTHYSLNNVFTTSQLNKLAKWSKDKIDSFKDDGSLAPKGDYRRFFDEVMNALDS